MFLILAPVFLSVIFLFVIIYLFCRNKDAPSVVFLSYSFSFLVQVVVLFTDGWNNKYASIASLNIFLLAEFLAFIIYIKRQIKNDSGSRFMLFSLQLFPMVTCYYWLYNDALHELQPFIIVIQFMIVIACCLFYYYEIFEEPPDLPLRNHYTFWMVNGMLTLSCLSIPLLLLMNGEYVQEKFLFGILYLARFFTCIIIYIFFHITLNCQINPE